MRRAAWAAIATTATAIVVVPVAVGAQQGWLGNQPAAYQVEVDGLHYTFTGPDSVVLDWRGEPADIRYGLTDSYGSNATASEPSPLPWSSTGPYREVELSDLEPGQEYHYSVGGGPDHVFSTAPTDNFTFVAVGDIGDSTSYPWVRDIAAQIAADDPSFVLALGDLTYGNYNCAEAVDQHFVDVEAWSHDAAYMPVWGNHEYADAGPYSQPCGIDDDFANYKGRFALPHPQTISADGPRTASGPGCPPVDGANPCRGEDWSWFDAGPVRFITGPEPFSGAVEEWQAAADALMAEAQADPDIRWIVTASHRPAWSSGGRTDADYRTATAALGDAHGKYVLHLNGHVHVSEVVAPQSGVYHVTAGAGGEGVDRLDAPLADSQLRLRHPSYTRFSVSDSSLVMDVVCGPTIPDADDTCTPGETVASVDVGLRPPAAGWAASCDGQTCTFDGSASRDQGGGPVSTYSWDFGDGSSGEGVAPEHGYDVDGVYTARLTVTDADGGTDTSAQAVTVGAADAVSFRAAASDSVRATVHRVRVPADVRAGDGLLAFLTTGTPARSLTVPAGWRLVDSVATDSVETFVLEATATAASAGGVLPLRLDGRAKATTTLLAYASTAPAGPVGVAELGHDTLRTPARTTPSVPLANPGALLVSYWADRAATTGWTLPTGVLRRTTSFGAGSPHTSAVTADSSGPVPTGTVGGLTATASGRGGHATTASVLLAPGGAGS